MKGSNNEYGLPEICVIWVKSLLKYQDLQKLILYLVMGRFKIIERCQAFENFQSYFYINFLSI